MMLFMWMLSKQKINKYSDKYQAGKKVLHKMMDIIMIVFFAMQGNADDWEEMEVFGREHEDYVLT